MRRRDLMILLGGAAAARPIGVRAQQSDRVRHLGVLMLYSENDPEGRSRVKLLEGTLQGLGWINGRNLQIDYRWADADRERFRLHAADLVRLNKDIIIAASTPATQAVQRETRTIPMIFTQVSDPVGQRIVDNMNRPGGMTTGFTNYDPQLGGKWLQLLQETVPDVKTVAVVFNPDTAPYTQSYLKSMQAAARVAGIQVVTTMVQDVTETENAFAKHARERNGGLIMMTDAFVAVHRKVLIELAARFALPAMYPYRYYVVDGGLMSYGSDQLSQYRGAAIYVDRILNGKKPGDLPVQAPDKYELVINMKTAKALDLAIPESITGRADEVIE